jgi:hypothetical protein
MIISSECPRQLARSQSVPTWKAGTVSQPLGTSREISKDLTGYGTIIKKTIAAA